VQFLKTIDEAKRQSEERTSLDRPQIEGLYEMDKQQHQKKKSRFTRIWDTIKQALKTIVDSVKQISSFQNIQMREV
jgi:hypothetical protein